MPVRIDPFNWIKYLMIVFLYKSPARWRGGTAGFLYLVPLPLLCEGWLRGKPYCPLLWCFRQG
jgi:hypothetical protein